MFSTPHNLSEFNLPLRSLAVENSFMSTNPGRREQDSRCSYINKWKHHDLGLPQPKLIQIGSTCEAYSNSRLICLGPKTLRTLLG
ncbi:hypothetical protein AV530_005295 [Patagioenas fasciata monilis]|uniref:Uncharacterized protein n=1 Tax=Patagioenas fasciata monilis TaxID=372326 RepID=A0A1V4JKS2_PATFA|nr:hypothetical protein AV530_005295 [Patagioenas fasciata monilis]